MIAILLGVFLSGCVASRSEIKGVYGEPASKNTEAQKVSVFFLFRHLGQQHGLDTIPKLQFQGVKDFDNIFRDSLKEISNISRYDTHTELPNDVNNPERRQKLDSLRAANDYTMDVTFYEESSFSQQFLSGTISLLSLTVIPAPYSWDYTITVDLRDKGGNLIRSYKRTSTLSNWVEALLIFAYPFYPFEGRREEIYSESLHDIFRQIEAEKVLK
jgi:hypothetical protein